MKDDIPAGESIFSHINACPKELLDFVTRPRLRVIFIDRIDFDGMGSDLALAEFSDSDSSESNKGALEQIKAGYRFIMRESWDESRDENGNQFNTLFGFVVGVLFLSPYPRIDGTDKEYFNFRDGTREVEVEEGLGLEVGSKLAS